ncbi:MAG: nucleotidyl transferase AbiEii/AbiGii toxin family protein [Deltaproteobacteria bacterium]|nr:nucleotidyl transferase AbiEii/AbiGii toxin family protein [Deltaproteobacteria bacterium]
MASSPASRLSALQLDVLRAFFARERGFFLTGGAALAGFHLGHRTTDDLDLFTTDAQAFERGRFVLQDLAAALGGRLEVRQDTPRFVRYVLTRATDALVIDLVHDQHPQHADKPERDGIRLDPADEILANKLTALVGRAEERDLVDVLCLERAGYRVEDALPAALAKDGGCTPATLAWLLSEIEIPDGIELPAGIAADELRGFVTGLIVRLRRAALP